MICIVICIGESHEKLIDHLCNKHFLMMEKVRGNNLHNFVSASVKSFSNITHLIVDLTYINDNQDEIVNAVSRLQTLYADMRIIVLADVEQTNKDLLRRIFSKGVYDILVSVTEETLEKSMLVGKTKAEASEFFVERPDLTNKTARTEVDVAQQEAARKMQAEQQARHEEAVREQLQKREQILPDKRFRKYKPYITVAVCGAEPHVGATHHALQMSKFLNMIGFKACYLEANETQKIFYLKSLYPQNSNFSDRKNLLQCFGVDIYSGFNISDVIAENYDIYVFDFGVITEMKLTSFLTKDLSVIVSGVKAWELNQLRNAMELLGTKKTVSYLLNFAIKDEEAKIRQFMSSLSPHAFFSAYEPNSFKGGVNIEIYKNIFKEYLIKHEEVLPQTKRRGLFSRRG